MAKTIREALRQWNGYSRPKKIMSAFATVAVACAVVGGMYNGGATVISWLGQADRDRIAALENQLRSSNSVLEITKAMLADVTASLERERQERDRLQRELDRQRDIVQLLRDETSTAQSKSRQAEELAIRNASATAASIDRANTLKNDLERTMPKVVQTIDVSAAPSTYRVKVSNQGQRDALLLRSSWAVWNNEKLQPVAAGEPSPLTSAPRETLVPAGESTFIGSFQLTPGGIESGKAGESKFRGMQCFIYVDAQNWRPGTTLSRGWISEIWYEIHMNDFSDKKPIWVSYFRTTNRLATSDTECDNASRMPSSWSKQSH